MTRWCVVPTCKTGSRTVQAKRSVFRVPKDPVMWKKWEAAIPGIKKLRQTDVVCEKHFNEEDVSREWIKLDANERVIAQVAYKYPHLKKCAVPMNFVNSPGGKENWDHSYAKKNSDFNRKSPTTENEFDISKRSSSRLKPSIFSTGTLVGGTRIPATALENQTDMLTKLSPTEIRNSKSPVPASIAFQELAKVPSSHKITKQLTEDNSRPSDDISAHVPDSWSCVRMRTEIVQHTLFTYSITKVENGERCPVSQKSVTLDADGTLKYFVYGRHVDPREKNLQRTLKNKDTLRDVLEKFRGMNVCSGLGDVDTHLVPADEVYRDYVDKWRSRGCSLLSREKRCCFCTKSRKCTLQRATRMKNRPVMSRISAVSNPIDELKLSAMRVELRRERRQKLRAKDCVKLLMERLKAQEAQLATTRDPVTREKCVEFGVSDSQKFAIQQIIAAPNKKQPETFIVSNSERLKNK